jgi:type 1 glutamine amidotransferase
MELAGFESSVSYKDKSRKTADSLLWQYAYIYTVMNYRYMTQTAYLLLVLIQACLVTLACKTDTTSTPTEEKPNVLIFTRTVGFRHESIEPGVAAIQSYFNKHGIASTHTEDSAMIDDAKLKDFDAIMFLLTTGNVLGSQGEAALQNFIRSGKGYVGVHSACDTEYDWPWYGAMTAAYFASHPDIQTAFVDKTDTSHISTQHLPTRWQRTDEWYNFKQLPADVDVLLKLDESTYTGGTHGDNHPISWCQEYDGGRAFFTAMGHTVESYQDTLFLEHIRQGLMWSLKK